MKICFLTGLIASGKSSVLEQLKKKGCQTISMDTLAREVVKSGSPCLERIVKAFGPEVLLPGTCELNRSYLASVVFGDAEALKRLEAIELPAILRLLEERLEQMEEGSCVAEEPCVVEVPVLSQMSHLSFEVDEVVYLKVPSEVREYRALQRGMEVGDFRARNALLPAESYLEEKSTIVLDGIANLSPEMIADMILDLVK